jgi:hypothetical protein
MARIKFSSLVNDIRGSVGGVTFSRNANGAYTRNRTKGTNRKSPGQLSVRASFSGLSAQYRQLGAASAQTFIDMAPLYPYKNKVGVTSYYTGQQLFMKLNSTLVQNGLPYNTVCSAPATIVPTIQGTYALSQSTPEFVMANYKFLTNGIVPDGQAVAVFASAPLSSGVLVAPAQAYRKICVLPAGTDFNLAATSTIVLEEGI